MSRLYSYLVQTVYVLMLLAIVALLIGTVFASADRARLAPHLRSSTATPAPATVFAPRSL